MTATAVPADLESISVCVPDHYGLLAGKRIAAGLLEAVLAHGLDMPDFHLITGPDIQPSAGVAATGDHTGFPNDVLWPDMQTFRRLPWDPASAVVLAEARRRDGAVIPETPRAILQRQTERLARRGLSAWVATELEFYVYEDSYPQSFRKGYRVLSPLYHRCGDNDVLVTEFLDQYLRPLRQAMAGLGLPAETTQGEGGAGQAEINFPPGAPVAAADGHALFKHAAKAIAYQRSCAVTFMAMPDQFQAGSGCHLHLSLRDEAGNPCTATPGGGQAGTELSGQARGFLAGLLAFSPELTLMHAPVVNSYRRLLKCRAGGPRRPPRGDTTTGAPWCAWWAAAPRCGWNSGCQGRTPTPTSRSRPRWRRASAEWMSRASYLPPMLPPAGGDRPVDTGAGPLPMDLTEAIQRFAGSKLARRAFGEDIRDHVTRMASHQLRLARRAVTDWELGHGFETA